LSILASHQQYESKTGEFSERIKSFIDMFWGAKFSKAILSQNPETMNRMSTDPIIQPRINN